MTDAISMKSVEDKGSPPTNNAVLIAGDLLLAHASYSHVDIQERALRAGLHQVANAIRRASLVRAGELPTFVRVITMIDTHSRDPLAEIRMLRENRQDRYSRPTLIDLRSELLAPLQTTLTTAGFTPENIQVVTTGFLRREGIRLLKERFSSTDEVDRLKSLEAIKVADDFVDIQLPETASPSARALVEAYEGAQDKFEMTCKCVSALAIVRALDGVNAQTVYYYLDEDPVATRRTAVEKAKAGPELAYHVFGIEQPIFLVYSDRRGVISKWRYEKGKGTMLPC